MTDLLLHVCCGPCAAGSVPWLREQGYNTLAYFFNPNIHPVTEFKARLDALRRYAAMDDLQLTVKPEYGLVAFARAVAGRETDRCQYCYALRLRQAALEAKRLGIALFSTTLLYSIHQKHDLIRDIAEGTAREIGVSFLYMDMRRRYAAGRDRWRALGLYTQKYCGCVYSEMDRYAPDGLVAETPQAAPPGTAWPCRS